MDLLGEAVAIADRLVADAVWHRGRCTWLARPVLGRDLAPGATPSLAPLGPTVYGGSAGIALFLARLAPASGDAKHRATAVGAVAHALHHANVGGPGAAAGPTGAAARWGYHGGALGIAWVAQEAAARLGEPGLARESRRIVRALEHHRAEPSHLDLTYGHAGAIPTLLALECAGDGRAGALARHLADELLAGASRDADALSWPMPPAAGVAYPRHLAGISHGASGMALGLAAIYAATGEARYREGALGAFRYERAAFDAARQTWIDLRRPPGADGVGSAQNRWCHGAPGIGMARALAMPLLKEEALGAEVRVARAATAATLRGVLASPGEDATLCCGSGGLVESLWAMDAALGDPEAARTARRLVAHQASLFGTEPQRAWPGFVSWPTLVAGGTHPGLMQGAAGIGHLLLRAHAGGSVANPLAPPLPN